MSVKKIEGYTIFLKERLGEGSFGSVYKAEKEETKEPLAVKIINKKQIDTDPYMKQALLSEVKVMRSVNSQNCVKCVDVMESTNNYYVIQELCDSDLSKYVAQDPNKKIDEKEAIKILSQICNGFLTLVKDGIVHRDLKPQNILLSNGKVKIGDFGFARKHNKGSLLSSIVGTPLYMAIQILEHKTYTSKCDIWGIGFIFYEILHGRTPWTAKNIYSLIKNLQNQPLKIDPQLSEPTQDFLRRSLGIREKDRMEWDELFRHEIFGGYFENKIQKETIRLSNLYKKVLSDIRFYIKAENIDLEKVWKSLGYEENKQLSEKEFYELIDVINPEMDYVEEKFFFDQMDQDKNGVVTLPEMINEFKKYEIPLVSAIKHLPYDGIPIEKEKKILASFDRLYQILTKKKITLHQVFEVYDKEKRGALLFDEFSKILTKLDPEFSDDELQLVFTLVDTDKSKTIDFDEFNNFYCKLSGIPEKLYQVDREKKNPQN